MRYRIRVAARAAKEIQEAAEWWRQHRLKASAALADEMERAFDLICSLPGAGEPVHHPRLKGVRRLLLGRIKYHLYYRLFLKTEVVEVLALWHTGRGSMPRL